MKTTLLLSLQNFQVSTERQAFGEGKKCFYCSWKKCNSSSLDETWNKAYLSKTRGEYEVLYFPEDAHSLYTERNSVRGGRVVRIEKQESGRRTYLEVPIQRMDWGLWPCLWLAGWLPVLAKNPHPRSPVCSAQKTLSCSNKTWEWMSQSFCIYKHLDILREYMKHIFERHIDFYIIVWR